MIHASCQSNCPRFSRCLHANICTAEKSLKLAHPTSQDFFLLPEPLSDGPPSGIGLQRVRVVLQAGSGPAKYRFRSTLLPFSSFQVGGLAPQAGA